MGAREWLRDFISPQRRAISNEGMVDAFESEMANVYTLLLKVHIKEGNKISSALKKGLNLCKEMRYVWSGRTGEKPSSRAAEKKDKRLISVKAGLLLQNWLEFEKLRDVEYLIGKGFRFIHLGRVRCWSSFQDRTSKGCTLR